VNIGSVPGAIAAVLRRSADAPANARERAQATALVQAVLRAEEGSVIAEQPAIWSAGATGDLRVRRDGGRIAAAAAIVARDAVTPRGRIRLGLIGCVATSPDARGRGHGRALLEICENDLRAAGCAAALLWADVPEFYSRCGYEACGAEVVLTIPKIDLSDLRACALYRPSYLGALECLRLAKPAHSERPRSESACHFGAPGAIVAIHRSPSGAIDGYAALGRGSDFVGTVHEWAGTPEVVLTLVAFLQKQLELSETFLVTSVYDEPLGTFLQNAGVEPVLGPLGMAKALDPAALAAIATPAVDADDSALLRSVLGEPVAPLCTGRVPLYPHLSGFDSI